MTGIKSKRDVYCLLILLVCLVGFIYLIVTVSAWWILSAPLYWVVSLMLAVLLSGGKFPKAEKLEGILVPTKLLTQGDGLKACTLCIQDDKLVIRPQGIEIKMEQLSQVMFEDKSQGGESMAGFGIDYEDSIGSASLIFFNTGLGSVRRTKKIVQKIRDTHAKYYAGWRVEPLDHIDVSALKMAVAASPVHRRSIRG